MSLVASAVEATRSENLLSWVWVAALGCFVVAGLTGALYRFGIAYGVTGGLNLVNIRHAHSHLMYFGWVTPALMALMWVHAVGRQSGSHRRAASMLFMALFAAAALAYPLFLAFGYAPVQIGDARIPLAVIASTLNMLVWYGFVVLYVRARGGMPAYPARSWMDAAVIFLVASTGGAWALGLLQPLGIHSDLWSSALTRIFLDLFSEGWLVLGVLGLAYAYIRPPQEALARGSLVLICCGVPLTFALGMPAALVPAPARVLASLGGVAAGVGLLISVYVLARTLARENWRTRWWWGVPLALLAVKAVAQLTISVLPGAWWTGLHGLRIFYLHVMLLGFVSLGLVAGARSVWEGLRADRWFYVAVGIMLASLLPMTSLWPGAGGRWMFVAAAWTALLPSLAAVHLLVQSVRERRTSVAGG